MDPSWDQSWKKIEDGWKNSENQKIVQKPMPKQEFRISGRSFLKGNRLTILEKNEV